ncbi:MAG TPA: hypothetical protein VGQ99_05675 [Tepidisphaeraceae bacterium]|jgi:hypothetical protein|nr:hypothetical protein [Tepidisphaeraceae bacterium]
MAKRSEEDEKPWTESQWEAFMKKADLRSARFGEILETVIDDPDRDAIVEKEMGWNFDDREPIEMPNLTPEEEAEIDQQMKEEDQALERMPAYQKSMEAATKVQRLLKPFLHLHADEADEEIGEAFINSHIPCAKISGGHAMGYDDDVLCANIVNNKIALAANQRCQEALRSLRDRKILPARKVDKVLEHVAAAGSLIERRIAELRSKVWW